MPFENDTSSKIDDVFAEDGGVDYSMAPNIIVLAPVPFRVYLGWKVGTGLGLCLGGLGTRA